MVPQKEKGKKHGPDLLKLKASTHCSMMFEIQQCVAVTHEPRRVSCHVNAKKKPDKCQFVSFKHPILIKQLLHVHTLSLRI